MEERDRRTRHMKRDEQRRIRKHRIDSVETEERPTETQRENIYIYIKYYTVAKYVFTLFSLHMLHVYM